MVDRRRTVSIRSLALLILGLAALVGLLRSPAPPSGSFHLTASVAARAATTASSHLYDGPARHATPRQASLSGWAVKDIEPGRQVSAIDRDRARISASGLAAEGLDDSVVLVRGGTNTADRFANGSGVTSDGAGNLSGVSVNSGQTVEDAAAGIKNNQIGVSSVGAVRNAGGTVTRAPTPNNPSHCLIGGCTADVFSDLFTPTIKNPWK